MLKPIGIALLMLLASATLRSQTSTESSIKLPTGETVTGRQVQDTLNQCSVVADLYPATNRLLIATEGKADLLEQQNALLQEQIGIFKQETIDLRNANADLQKALADARQGNVDRDKEIVDLKARVKQLENKHTATWKKVLMVVAGIALGRMF